MVTAMPVWRSFAITAAAFVYCYAAPATGEHAKSVKVTSCRERPRAPPIARRCVAAAIAEEAYLNAAVHGLSFYTIYSLSSSTSGWDFVIEEGDEAHPPQEGTHWFIRVDRASGNVTVDAGR